NDVHQTNKVHAVFIKTVPARALRSPAVALEILLALVARHVMLAWNIKRFFHLCVLQNLLHIVELFRLRKMRYVSRVQQKLRISRQSVDLCYRRFQCADHIRIRGFVESHVAVADLHKAQLAHRCGRIELGKRAQAVGVQHASLHHAERARSCPSHALQKSSPVNSVPVMVKLDFVFCFVLHCEFLSLIKESGAARVLNYARRSLWTTCCCPAVLACPVFYSSNSNCARLMRAVLESGNKSRPSAVSSGGRPNQGRRTDVL